MIYCFTVITERQLIISTVPWNLNITKCQGTGKICEKKGVVMWRFFSTHFTSTGVNKISCYIAPIVQNHLNIALLNYFSI